jgi:hypothetical protein
VLSDTTGASADVLKESVLLSAARFAAKMVDRDVSPAALAADPNATGPAITMKEAQLAVMNLEGIPRYDHVFLIVLENKATSSIKNSKYARASMPTSTRATSSPATTRPASIRAESPGHRIGRRLASPTTAPSTATQAAPVPPTRLKTCRRRRA